MNRKVMVWLGAVAAVAVATTVFAWAYSTQPSEGRESPSPKKNTYTLVPKLTTPSGVIGMPENGPLPPIFDDGDPAVAVGGVGPDRAYFLVDAGGPYRDVTIHVGESATLDGVTIALCAVSYNAQDDAGDEPSNVGAPLVNPSWAYFVLSRDGSVPTCP